MGRRGRHAARTGSRDRPRKASRNAVEKTPSYINRNDIHFEDDSLDDEDHDVEGQDSQDDLDHDLVDKGVFDLETNSLESDYDSEDNDEEKKSIEKLSSQWGKKKSEFYSEAGDYDEGDEEAALDEEAAALELQQKAMEELDEDDYDNGLVGKIEDDDEEEDDSSRRKVLSGKSKKQLPLGDLITDLSDIPLIGTQSVDVEKVLKEASNLSQKDKLDIVENHHPEVLQYLKVLKKSLKELKKMDDCIAKSEKVLSTGIVCREGLNYQQLKRQLLVNYCTNIAYFLRLKASGERVVEHPVKDQIKKVKDLLKRLKPIDVEVMDDLDVLCSMDVPDESSNVETTTTDLGGDTCNNTSRKRKSNIPKEECAQAEAYYNEIAKQQGSHKKVRESQYSHPLPTYDNVQLDEMEGKRGASYQIMKNRGLTAHKNKINRNPRVKKRVQFKKAVIRRKGQVRDVRVGEAAGYGGEMSGIKSNLTRSRKLNKY